MCLSFVTWGVRCQRTAGPDAHRDGFHVCERGYVRWTRPVWSAEPREPDARDVEPELDFERQR